MLLINKNIQAYWYVCAFKDYWLNEPRPQQTCTIGYAVAGTWNNSNYKNNPTTTTAVHVAKDIPLLASGDSHGYIRLFRYPCPSSAAKFVEVKGSSSAITDISFIAGDQYLLTVCGSNVSLMRWKIV